MSSTGEKAKISFGISKRAPKLVAAAAVPNSQPAKQEVDYVTALEDRQVKSTLPTVSGHGTALVIPLIQQNDWRRTVGGKRVGAATTTENSQAKHPKLEKQEPVEAAGVKQEPVEAAAVKQEPVEVAAEKQEPVEAAAAVGLAMAATAPNLEQQAVAALQADARRLRDGWDERGDASCGRVVPLLLANAVPDGFETDDKLDVSIRPDEPEDADYDSMPVESFGLASLRGMGYTPGESTEVKSHQVSVRLRGLGLGADAAKVEAAIREARGQKNGSTGGGGGAELEWRPGALLCVKSGRQEGRYGEVLSVDGDTGRVHVRLSVDQLVVSLLQSACQLVSKAEFQRFSRYLNKNKADARSAQTTAELLAQPSQKTSGASVKQSSSSSASVKQSSSSGAGVKQSSSSGAGVKQSSSSGAASCWAAAGLRARVVDKRVHGGQLFERKVDVREVLRADTGEIMCRCRRADDNSRVSELIPVAALETVIPREPRAWLRVVAGQFRGRAGRLLERRRDRQQVRVELAPLPRSSRDAEPSVVDVAFDDVCQLSCAPD